MQFLAKIMPSNKLVPPSGIDVPPLGNPGSATGLGCLNGQKQFRNSYEVEIPR